LKIRNFVFERFYPVREHFHNHFHSTFTKKNLYRTAIIDHFHNFTRLHTQNICSCERINIFNHVKISPTREAKKAVKVGKVVKVVYYRSFRSVKKCETTVKVLCRLMGTAFQCGKMQRQPMPVAI
jgi:hypothetical protein